MKPSDTTAPHVNTFMIIRNIAMTTVPTVILSEAKDLSTVISTKRSAWRNL